MDLTRWDKELEEGVLLSCCSGVVSGPSMLAENTTTVTAAPTPPHTPTHKKRKTRRTHVSVGGGVTVGVLDDQVVVAGRPVSGVHELAPVAGWQGQQPLHHLSTEARPALRLKLHVLRSCAEPGFGSPWAGVWSPAGWSWGPGWEPSDPR